MLNYVQYAALLSLFLVVGVFWGIWLSLSRSYDQFSIPELHSLAKVMMPNLAMPMRFLSCLTILLMSATAYFILSKMSKEFYFALASIVLVLTSLLITILIEVPINNQVLTWTITSAPDNWKEIMIRWIAFNRIRTIAAVLSFVFFITAILKPFKKDINA